MVLDHQAGPLGRVWCLFEIWITVREKGMGSLHLLTYGFTNNDIRECFQVRSRSLGTLVLVVRAWSQQALWKPGRSEPRAGLAGAA